MAIFSAARRGIPHPASAAGLDALATEIIARIKKSDGDPDAQITLVCCDRKTTHSLRMYAFQR